MTGLFIELISSYSKYFFYFMKIKFKILENYLKFLFFLIIITTNSLFLRNSYIKFFSTLHYLSQVYHFRIIIWYSITIFSRFLKLNFEFFILNLELALKMIKLTLFLYLQYIFISLLTIIHLIQVDLFHQHFK